MKVKFYEKEKIGKNKLKFVVIISQHKNKWIMVRHKKRSTWEIPGGHIEKNEEIENAAKRELYEETGALEFDLIPISIYSVCRYGESESFGQLYYAKVKEIGELPESEIGEIKLFEELPSNLTYPTIQTKIFKTYSKLLLKEKF